MGLGNIMRKKAVKNASIAMSLTAEKLISTSPNLIKEQLFILVLLNFDKDIDKAEAEIIVNGVLPSGLQLLIWYYLRVNQIIPVDKRNFESIVEEIEEKIPKCKETKFREELEKTIEASIRNNAATIVHKGWL
ncbi:MAG: hypothetical protein HQ568_11555 [Calditrichaeota bacterium]|nr:hypothetical protein [Calditrichota bacterium]